MKIVIEVSESDLKFLRSFCIGRPMKAAAKMMDHVGIDMSHDPEVFEESSFLRGQLVEVEPVVERIRSAIVNAANRREWEKDKCSKYES